MEQPNGSGELQKQVAVAAAEVILLLNSRGATPRLEDLASLFGLSYDYQSETRMYFASSRKSRYAIANHHRTTWEVCIHGEMDALTRLATLVLAVVISTVNDDREVLVHFANGSQIENVVVRNGRFDRSSF